MPKISGWTNVTEEDTRYKDDVGQLLWQTDEVVGGEPKEEMLVQPTEDGRWMVAWYDVQSGKMIDWDYFDTKKRARKQAVSLMRSSRRK